MNGAITLVRRGQIVLVSLDPAVGSEATKTRPAVIVSNNTANAAAMRSDGGVITVVPLTSNTTRVHDFQVFVPTAASGLPQDAKAQAEQVRSISASRITGVVGWMQAELLGAIDDALRLHLAL